MQKKLLFFFFFIPFCLKSQTFAEIGSYWKYDWRSVAFIGEMRLWVKGDTIVDNKVCRNFYADKYTAPPLGFQNRQKTILPYGVTYVQNDSVFLKKQAENWQFVYSFKANIGDTVRFPTVSNRYTRYAVVGDTSREFFGGSMRKTWLYTTYCNGIIERNTVKVIDKQGIINNFLFWRTPDCGFLDLEPLYTFTCFSSPNFTYPSRQNCSPTVSTIDVSQQDIQILPNPANNVLEITMLDILPETEMCIFDIAGNLLYHKAFLLPNTVIDIADFPKGIYFLSLHNKDFSSTKKWIKL